jgi:legumain
MKYAATLALIFCLIASVLANPPIDTNWAVLVAGSNGYENYRHQADICHAFQTLRSNGFPDDKIIVFMYDDIAHSSQNPHKGEIINKPGGTNVYPGVLKDYTGKDCTAANFLAVLSGQKSKVKGGSGRVVESGPNDNIFVFYSDHGAVGLVAMPVGPYLYAKDLVATLNTMAKGKRFNQFVFYLEACESGSMFENLLSKNISIYATTASNAFESSYACYYDATRNAYLGDLYSVNWMEDTDANDPHSEDFETQYNTIKIKTNLSHVMQYGDLTFDAYKLFDFMGFNKLKYPGVFAHGVATANASVDAVDSRDVNIELLERRIANSNGPQKELLRMQLREEINKRYKVDRIFRNFDKFARSVTPVLATNLKMDDNFDWDCYKDAIENFELHCGKFTDYSLKYAKNLAIMCASGIKSNNIAHFATKICKTRL